MKTFSFPKLVEHQPNNPSAKMHDCAAVALERALIGVECNRENVRNLVGGMSAMMIGLCLEHGIDPSTIFSAQMVDVIVSSARVVGEKAGA